MALFTTADRDAIKAAYLQALVDGVASATIGGQSVTGWTVEQWKKALDQVQADLTSGNSHGGIRLRQMTPGGTG